MQDRSNATSSWRRRPVAAIVAVVLAFALAFMAFEPNALRSAFANEGEAVSADASQHESAGTQATEPTEDEQGEKLEPDGDEGLDEGAVGDEPAFEGDAENEEQLPADEPVGTPGGDSDGTDARAGPADDADEGETAPADPQATEKDAVTDSEDGSEAKRAKRQSGARAAYASCTVTFYDNAASAKPSILARKLVSAEAGQMARVVVSDVVANAPTSAQVFSGWNYAGATVTDAIEVDPRDGNVNLYPVFSSGHWLRFVEGDAGSGAAYVASRFVGAGDSAPTALPTTTRPGYAFEGWHTGSISNGIISYGDQVSDENGAVNDPATLRAMLSAGDVELYAKWRGVETTYRLISWHQATEGNGYVYQGSTTVGGDGSGKVISGEMTDVSQVPEVAGFKALPIAQQRIAGDGSTVVNAYYDREIYKVVFHQGRTDASDLFDELTIEDRYGADIHDKWPKPSESGGRYSASWYTLPQQDSNVFVTGIGTMPLGGASFYLKNDTGMNCNTVYMIQNVDGTDEFSEYVSQPFSTENSPLTTADDYMPIKGFMVNASSPDDAAAIQAIAAGDKNATHDPAFKVSAQVGSRYADADEVTQEGDVARHTLYFYYLRCQYDIVFEENGGPEVANVEDVYYEASLSGLAPSDYKVGETKYTAHDGEVYQFEGWFDNPDLENPAFDFSSRNMPAGNVVLYAKWTPAKYLVQVDPDGGEFVSAAQSTYFWVNHGAKIDYIGVERHYVADDGGEFVYDYETASSDSDNFGNAVYVTAQSGDTGQRYSRSEDAYSLYGWFRVDSPARAEVPFDFNTPITEDTSIVARWRAAGMFDIAYNPTMDVADGSVTGDIDVMLDAGYADLSPTYVMNTPENIESTTGDEYTFSGWQVVENFDEGAEALDDELYVEGDGFVVDSDLATNNTIHLQAVYEEVPKTPADTVDPSTPTTPSNPSASAGDNNVKVEGNTIVQRVSGTNSALPKTGDEAQMLAIGIGGIALLALGVALIARAMRRAHLNEE